VTLLPLALLWISGTAAHGSPFWILAKNVNTQVVSTGHLPVLDGAIGSFLSGGAAGIAKGALLAGVVTFAVILATLSIRQKAPEYLTGAGICASLALWWLVLNQVEIWSVARFSRLLVLPLVWVSSRHFSALPRSPGWRAAMLAGLAGLVLSQFAYAWYMAKVFYA